MSSILELDGETITYAEFRDKCLVPNRPAVIHNAHLSARQSAAHSPVPRPFFPLSDLHRCLQPQTLRDTFGSDHVVPAYPMRTPTCAYSEKVRTTGSELNVTERSAGDVSALRDGEELDCMCDVQLGRVLDSWHAMEKEAGGNEVIGWYLKDWHYLDSLRELPAAGESGAATLDELLQTDGGAASSASSLRQLYEVPPFLGEDWLNPFCDTVVRQSKAADSDSHVERFQGFGSGSTDYRFVYCGPLGTLTPLHYDVFGTYSWSLNVQGHKLWYFPADDESNELLLNNLRSGGAETGGWDIRVLTGIRLAAFVQRPGDLVFVPSRYYHQVHNISLGAVAGSEEREDEEEEGVEEGLRPLVVSVNHNWCNVYCVEHMMDSFAEHVQQLKRVVCHEDRVALCGDDAAAWLDHVERMLLTSTNWNFGSVKSFLNFSLLAFGSVVQREEWRARAMATLLTPEALTLRNASDDEMLHIREVVEKCVERVEQLKSEILSL